MNWWQILIAFLGNGREAPAVRTAPKPEPVPVPPLSTLAIPAHAVGETTSRPFVPPAAITLLHYYESCARKLPGGMIAPYLDSGGVPTIGWGNTFYADGRRVRMGDAPITQAQADALFEVVLADFSRLVLARLPLDADDDAHAAFLSFAYNVGVQAMSGSTALKRFKAGDRGGAGLALELWDKAGGKVLKGLQRRRRAEKLVLLGATADSAIAAAEKAFPGADKA